MVSSKREKYTVPQMPVDSRKENHLAIFNSTYITDIPYALSSWSCSRAVLVVSRSLDTKTDKISRLESALGDTLVGKKVGVAPHSPYADVLDIAKLLYAAKADSLVCIGSSSYSDACKIARLLHATLEEADLTSEKMEKLVDQKKGRTPPGTFGQPAVKLILLPCSLSVSEYNAVSSATSPSGKKQHFGQFDEDNSAPELVLLDPEVASTAPPESLWLPSGIRAIDHCVESLCNSKCEEECAEYCERGLKLLLTGLKKYKEGLVRSDGEAGNKEGEGDQEELYAGISSCQEGARDAITGLVLFRNSLGPSHAIGHQLGSVGNVPHGMTSCICLAPVLRYEKAHPENDHWNVKAQERVLKIFNETLEWGEKEAGNAVERFVKSLGLPTRLSEVGVGQEDMLQSIAEKTMTDIWGGGEQQIGEPLEIMNILETVR